MKHKTLTTLALLFISTLTLWAASTKIRQAAITNSTIDSTTLGATSPSTAVVTSLTDSGLTAGNCFSVGASGLLQTATYTCPQGTVYSTKNLGGTVSVSATTLTTVDSITVNAAGGSAPAFPASGGSWRVRVCYDYGIQAGTGVYGEMEVTDGTNVFAKTSLITNAGGGVYSACGLSPVTYGGGSNITFTTKVENTGSQSILTGSALIGFTSAMDVWVVGSN